MHADVNGLRMYYEEHGAGSPLVLLHRSPVLVVIGDSDIVRPEHAIELFRLLGGGVIGDVNPLPASQLAVLPGTSHVTVVHKVDWLSSMALAFIEAPTSEP